MIAQSARGDPAFPPTCQPRRPPPSSDAWQAVSYVTKAGRGGAGPRPRPPPRLGTPPGRGRWYPALWLAVISRYGNTNRLRRFSSPVPLSRFLGVTLAFLKMKLAKDEIKQPRVGCSQRISSFLGVKSSLQTPRGLVGIGGGILGCP